MISVSVSVSLSSHNRHVIYYSISTKYKLQYIYIERERALFCLPLSQWKCPEQYNRHCTECIPARIHHTYPITTKQTPPLLLLLLSFLTLSHTHTHTQTNKQKTKLKHKLTNKISHVLVTPSLLPYSLHLPCYLSLSLSLSLCLNHLSLAPSLARSPPLSSYTYT